MNGTVSHQLFNIQLLHSYFSDGVFKSCKVIADSDTKKLIDRYRILTRMNEGIFYLYAPFQYVPVDFVQYLDDQLGGEPLRFLLTANEEQFVSITELPLDWLGQVSLNSKSVIQEKAKGHAAFQLKPELSDRKIIQPNVIGVISIYLDDLLAMECKDIRYVIEFNARSLHWVYYLINRSQTKLNNPIICSKDRYLFDGPESVVFSNGEKGLSFHSGETPFPLEQVPSKLFDLVDRLPALDHTEFSQVERCLIQGLPTPNEGQFSVKQKDTGKYIFSEMYIYL